MEEGKHPQRVRAFIEEENQCIFIICLLVRTPTKGRSIRFFLRQNGKRFFGKGLRMKTQLGIKKGRNNPTF